MGRVSLKMMMKINQMTQRMWQHEIAKDFRITRQLVQGTQKKYVDIRSMSDRKKILVDF